MNRCDGYKYYVIKFCKLPFKGVDKFVCIPSSWILRRETDKKVLVAYPVENSTVTEWRVKLRQRLSKDWRTYVCNMAHKKYGTDSYVDAQNFIKEQSKRKCPNGGPELSGKKKAEESKREHKSNHKMAVPEEFVVLKNNECATKIKLKRLATSKARPVIKIQPSVPTFDSFESSESDSEVAFSSNVASESSSKNPLSKNDNCVKQINNFERNMNKTTYGIRNSSNLANRLLDPIITNNKKFFTGFLKFLRENPEKAEEALKLRTPNNNISTTTISKGTTAKMTMVSGSRENVGKDSNDEDSNDEDSNDEDSNDEDRNDEYTLEGTTAEVTKLSRSSRNVEKKQNDDDDGDEEDQILNKNRCHEQIFALPPEYDDTDSRWTLKYQKSAPGLVELKPHTGVYINAAKLISCMRLAEDCNTLARNVMAEIFKPSALSVCSWTGKKGKGYKNSGVRPGLNKKARLVLMEFVKEYGRFKGWETNSQSILRSIRNRLQRMRREPN